MAQVTDQEVSVSRTARLAAGLGGVLVAAAIGVTGAAVSSGTATLPAAPVAATMTPTSDAPAPRQPGNAPGHGHHQDGSLTQLATALGVDEATMRSALDGARAEVRAQRPKPAGAAAAQAAMIKAVAAKLGKSETQVREAFQAFMAAHQAGSRDALARRLDAAVAAGRLTAAERAAVLKAYDAGVLGRGPGATGRMGHPGGPTKSPTPRA
jgi:hypothetical protein